jgi:nitroreductase
MLVVVDAQCGDPGIDVQQRIFSAGCAVQNLLLMATAMGYGSSLTSGKAMHSAPLRGLFHLGEHEHALCFVNLGTITSAKPPPARPTLDDYVRTLTADGQVVGIHPDIQTAP